MKTVELEEFDSNSSKIPFFQKLSLFFLVFPFFSFFIIYLLSFFFPQTSLANGELHEIDFNNFSRYNISIPIAIIDFHTSKSSFYRINFLYENYWKNNFLLKSKLFKIRIIYSNLFELNSKFINFSLQDNIQLVSVNCFDTIHSLPCRVDSSYKSFLHNAEREKIGWLYRATDDSYINFENLYHYIINLNKYYDPLNDLVIRAHANFEMKSNYYIHGGPGYLMSREYVKYHFLSNLTLSRLQNFSKYEQDDTAESIIVRKIFSQSYKQWDEFYIDGFRCNNCNVKNITNNIFPKCPPDKRIGVLSKIISIHLFGLRDQQSIFLSLLNNQSRFDLSETLFNNIKFYNDDNAQSLYLCTSKYRKIEDLNINRHKKIKISQLRNPLIDFNKLTPESLFSHLYEV